MVFLVAFGYNNINIIFHSLTQVLSKDSAHSTLVGRLSIFYVTVLFLRCMKGHMLFIIGMHFNLIIPSKTIHKRQA